MTTLKLCECGCGQQTPLHEGKTCRRAQLVKGQPRRFIDGHQLVGERFVCGLVAHPEIHLLHQDMKSQASEYLSHIIAQGLGVGRGCDSQE